MKEDSSDAKRILPTLGCMVRVTNKFDRLFFEKIGKVTHVEQILLDDGTTSTTYYVVVAEIGHGRWFQIGELEVEG